MAQFGEIKKIEDVSVEQIIDTYKKGYITSAQKNNILRRKARSETEKVLGKDGIVAAIFSQSIKNIQDGWEDIKEGATSSPGDFSLDTFKSAGQIMWGQIQVLTSAVNAVGQVTGAQFEQLALDAGASPGLAKTIGVVADVGTGIVPVGLASRSGVKGIQGIQKMVARVEQKMAAKQATKQVASAADNVVDNVIAQGLKTDGVQGLERFVTEGDDILRNIKVAAEKVDSQSDFINALKKAQAELRNVTAVQTHEMAAKKAESLGIILDDVANLRPGQTLNQAEMFAHLKALDPVVDNLIEQAKKGIAGDERALHETARLFTELFHYSPKFRAVEAEAGRSVEILKEVPPMKAITEMLMRWNPEDMARGDFKGVMRVLAEDIIELGKEKAKALQVMGSNVSDSPTMWEMVREGYVNLLLARPLTQVRNFIGNMASATNDIIEREMAGIFSLDKNRRFSQRMFEHEGIDEFHGMMAALGDGFKQWGKAYGSVDPNDISKLDFIPHKIPGPLGRIINTPGDTMRGMDNFFKWIIRKGDHYREARKIGREQGLTGAALDSYTAMRARLPSPQMMEHADSLAVHLTYQDELGHFGKLAQQGLQKGPLALWFPFMKTPINITKYVWNRTPGLQLISKSLYDDIAEGGARADMAVGRLTLSNLTAMFWYGLAQQGLITGGGPVNPLIQGQWKAVKQPYSIWGGDGYYPLTNLEPTTTPMALMADFAEIQNQLHEPDMAQTAAALALAGTRDIVDKTYWRTFGDIIDFLGDVRTGQPPSKRALSILAGPAVTATSFGPIGATVARANDPVLRETRSVIDDWRAKTLGYSKTLPPTRDIYGDPILIPQALGAKIVGPLASSLVLPITFKEKETDPIKLEGNRLSISAPRFPWKIGGGKISDTFDLRESLPGDLIPTDITPKQRDRWQQIYSSFIRNPNTGLLKLMESNEYKNATFAMQRKMFMDAMAASKEGARFVLLGEDKELNRQVFTNMVQGVMPFITPDERPLMEQRAQSALDKLDAQSERMQGILRKWGIDIPGPEQE